MAKTELKSYIVNVQGKDFITFPGLLHEAHALGLKSIVTDLVNSDLKFPVIKATVVMGTGGQLDSEVRTFTGYGDATEHNVAPMVKRALLRMAETRAIARALRFACNIDMTAIEELDSEYNSSSPTVNKKTTPASSPTKQTASKPTTPVTSNRTPTNSPKIMNKRIITQNTASETKVEHPDPTPSEDIQASSDEVQY